MEIILLQDIDNLGYKHDRVKVKPGYGRNFLIPQKMAVIANKPNLVKLDALVKEEEAKENEEDEKEHQHQGLNDV